ncbi:hypothetical protein IMZ48_18045 [Candidatus Bathyarchaeota archaeon]|nr:hypothetical protein [Candidatus Bathyarchaeota archaeon]
MEEAKEDPLIEEKLAVRRWDDLAKVPGITVPGLETYEEMTVKCLQRGKVSGEYCFISAPYG